MTFLVFICAWFDDLSKASEFNNKLIPEIVDQEKLCICKFIGRNAVFQVPRSVIMLVTSSETGG